MIKTTALIAVVAYLIGLVDPVSAGNGMTFGDGLAFFLIFGIAVIGILACLGQYSRRVSSGQY